MSGRTTSHLPHDDGGERPDAPPILVIGLSEVPTQSALHTGATIAAITRWEHEAVLETMQRRLDRQPQAMTLRRRPPSNMCSER